MTIYGQTDIGKKRQMNQDSFFNAQLTDNAVFSVVCDGMGGAMAGNVASQIAVDTIYDYVKKSYIDSMNEKAIENVLRSAVTTANINVYDESQKNRDYSGMGTTAVVALVRNGIAHIAHVGDSRAYLISKDFITQITRDHSVVQSLVEGGHLTAEEARSHPKKNIITRAVGVTDDVIVDYNEVNIKDSSLLLCSDGLSGMLTSKQILSVVNNCNKQDIISTLINLANDYGGEDNITVTLITE